MINFKWKVPKSPLFDSKLAGPFLAKNRKLVFASIMPLYQTGIIMAAPVGATGLLRKNVLIHYGDMKSAIANEVEYAAAVNDGRKAAPIAMEAQLSLEKWVRLSSAGRSWFAALKAKYKKITVEQAVNILRWSKKKKRTPGKRFFEKGIFSAGDAVNKQLEIILSKMKDEIV